MRTDLETRILELLREAPARTLPLREVHSALVAEFGTRAGSLEQLRERLRSDPGTLLVVEPDDPLGDGTVWPAGARAEYERALRDAGLDIEPRVTAFVATGTPRVLEGAGELDRSLVELWEAAGNRPALRAAIANALMEVRAPRPPPD
ncbi:MAG: hypothetical protein PVH00_15695 [Gemmatimonadota bacterium]|jgi:hypothetical protein